MTDGERGGEVDLRARLFEGMPHCSFVWTLDEDGVLRLVAANRAARGLSLVGADALEDELFSELFPASALPAALLDGAHTQRASRLTRVVGRDARTFSVEIVPLGQGAVGALFTAVVEGDATTPAPSSARTSTRNPSPSGTPKVRSGKILIVDDEPMVGRLVERALGRAHRVTAVTTGREGLDLLVAGERFDIILCDLMMPEITGMDLYERVLAFSEEQAGRMVFLTGGAFTSRARQFLEQRPFLEKPFDLSALESLVRKRME